MLTYCMKQDCVYLIVPCPFNDRPPELFDPATDFDMTEDGKICFARPQLFFTCVVRPHRHKENVTLHKKLSLIF